MRPGTDAVELEVVGISHRPALRCLRRLDGQGNSIALGVGDRFLAGVKPQLDLLAGV